MADNISVSIDGADRVVNIFSGLSEKMSNQIKRKLQASADRVLAVSQVEVPVDKGDLKDSGHVEPDVVSLNEMSFNVVYGDGSSTSTIYTYDDMDANGYAWFVELGTVKMAAQPYLGPAFEEESQKLVQRLGNLVNDL